MAGDREETRAGARDLLLSFTQVTAEGGFLTSELYLETRYVGPSAGEGEQVQEMVDRHARERGRVQAACYSRRMAAWFRAAAKAQEAQLEQQEIRWDDLGDDPDDGKVPGSLPLEASSTDSPLTR